MNLIAALQARFGCRKQNVVRSEEGKHLAEKQAY
jgi:hypothetical protein